MTVIVGNALANSLSPHRTLAGSRPNCEDATVSAAAMLSLAASLSEQVAALPGLCVLQQRRVLHVVIARVLCAKGQRTEILWALA